MNIAGRIREILGDSADSRTIADVRVGLKYTAALLNDGSCGVAFSFNRFTDNEHAKQPDIGGIVSRSADEILSWITAENLLQRIIGFAAANAINVISVKNAIIDDVRKLIDLKPTDRVVMVGYFRPLESYILQLGCSLEIYELDTGLAPGLKDSSLAPPALRKCDVAVITGTAVINNTIDYLLESAEDCREVAVVGPSTPLVPEAFAGTSTTLLSGVIPTDKQAVLEIVSSGGGMRQFKPFVSKVNYVLNRVSRGNPL